MSCAARSDEWGHGWGYYHRPMFWHPGWILLIVLGFVFWWPIGLAILFFTLWGRRMSCWGGHGYEHWQAKMERVRDKMERFHSGGWAGPSSGNRAFDEYRSETLQRLEEELDTPLFTRANRGVRLTEAGHKLLESAQRILRDV